MWSSIVWRHSGQTGRRWLASSTPFEVEPIRTKEQLLQRMVDYARSNTRRAADGGALPTSFAGDADKVLRGEKAVVTDNDPLEFGCTSCGKCCRQLAASILLDPFDVWTMSRALGQTTETLQRSYDEVAFTKVLGCFAPEQDDMVDAGQPQAPLMFAYSLPVLMMKVDAGQACHFARPFPGDAPDSDRLICSLGRAGQPTACALYPLGELWKSEQTGTAFYSLDRLEHCDGLVFGKHTRLTTVRDYLRGNGIDERQRHWAWYQKLAHRLALNRFPVTSWKRPSKSRPFAGVDDLDAESSDTLNAAVGIVHDILYNFDALPVAPKGGFASWSDAADTVERAIGAVDELSKVLAKSHYTVTDDHPPEQWLRLFEEAFYAPLIELGFVVMPTEEESAQFEAQQARSQKQQPQQQRKNKPSKRR